ncbi:transcription factor HES-4-like [Montipora foliosa]|uniref:transcription factor HES-4-like n=1 Tax=Montipora foliosa TaxID=591990 RepID=UPI0035F18E0C
MVLESTSVNSTPDNRRKSSKPLMEKRRRARINQSLNELKDLILEAMKKDTSCYSKLEKADILEMTVRYLRSMRSQSITARMNANDPNTIARYRAGYNECANEMTRYLMSLDGMDTQARSRLLAHLASFCTPCSPVVKPTQLATENLQQMQQPQAITIPMTQPLGPASFSTNLVTKHTEINPGSLLNATQFQIVPGQLANGKIAAVLLPSQNSPLAMVNSPQLIPVFNKAFAQRYCDQPQALRPADNDPLWRPW